MSTRDRILAAAYALLYREGFARTGMDAIAAAAGVTKRTLYYHFDSKDALAAAVLEAQHDLAIARIRGWADVDAASPAEYAAGLFAALEAWTRTPRWVGSGFTRLTMELAHLKGHPARRAARRHKAAVEDMLRSEFELRGAAHPEVLARQVAVLIEGSMCLCLIHDHPAFVVAAGRAAVLLAAAE